MADIADQAAEAIDAEREHNIAQSRASGPFARLRPCGRCHWCYEPVPGGHTHCAPTDDSCAEDHEKHMRFAR